MITVHSTFERDGWHHPSITEFIFRLMYQSDYGVGFIPVHNFVPAASGRNVICKYFHEKSEADWICMIDNDMHIPDNLLDTIKDAPDDAGIVVPKYYMWDESKPIVKLCMGIADDSPEILTIGDKCFIDFKKASRFMELTKCGTGVIFIRKSVFDKVPYPWFKYRYNNDQGMDGTEDIWFCEQVTAAGIKIYGNTKITVGHYHNVNLSTVANLVYGTMQPIIQNSIDKPQNKDVPSYQADGRPPEAETASA